MRVAAGPSKHRRQGHQGQTAVMRRPAHQGAAVASTVPAYAPVTAAVRLPVVCQPVLGVRKGLQVAIGISREVHQASAGQFACLGQAERHLSLIHI